MLLWLCHGVAAMDVVQVAVQPLRVQLRSGQSVTIFEVVNQDDALDAAIADDSDPFGAVCWPASVAAANELAALSPQFFEEVEDLKYAYATAQQKLERYEAVYGAVPE